MPGHHAGNYKGGPNRTCGRAEYGGRIARDEVEAYITQKTVKRLDAERKREQREREKRAAVTLPKAPWE